MAKKDRKWILSPKIELEFCAKAPPPSKSSKAVFFLLVRVCRQKFCSFPCIVDLIGRNSRKNFIRFIHCDLFLKQPPEKFSLKRFYPHICLCEKTLKWQTRAKFCTSEPFLPQKVEKVPRIPFLSKIAESFFSKQLAASICYSTFFLIKTYLTGKF